MVVGNIGNVGQRTVSTRLCGCYFLQGFDFSSGNDVVQEVYEFVKIYGTHIVTEMKLGSKFIYERTMKKTDVQDMTSQCVDVSIIFSNLGYKILS